MGYQDNAGWFGNSGGLNLGVERSAIHKARYVPLLSRQRRTGMRQHQVMGICYLGGVGLLIP